MINFASLTVDQNSTAHCMFVSEKLCKFEQQTAIY